MAKFKYKFDSIKNIKERLEKKSKKELAIIDLEIKRKLNEIRDINELLKKSKLAKTKKKTKSSEEIHFLEKYENYLSEQISLIEKYVNEKRSEREEKVKELMQRSKETKTFVKLEEKHFEEFSKQQNKIDQKEMDEIAIQEFIKE